MIEGIGSIPVPQAKSDEYAVTESDQVVVENEKLVEERPVEETDNEPDSKLKSDQKEEGNGKEQFLLKDNKMVFEKYNGSGEVILQIPPLHEDSA